MTENSSFRKNESDASDDRELAGDSERHDESPQLGLTDEEKRQALGDDGNVAPDPENKDPISEFHAKKLETRRTEWLFDASLFVKVVGGIAVVGLLLAGSYYWQSARSSSTFVTRADAATKAGNAVEEAKWLKRYLMMHPGDDQVIVRLGFAADRAVEQVSFESRGKAIEEARVRLTNAKVAAANEEDQERVRWRLMERLLQQGGFYFREVESNLLDLNPPSENAEAHRLLGLSLYGLIADSLFRIRSPLPEEREANYWEALSREPVGKVLRTAIEQNPGDIGLVDAFLNLAFAAPQYFVPKGELPTAVDLAGDQILQQAVQEILKQESSRAVLVAASYQQGIGKQDEAYRLIFDRAAKAWDRLSRFSAAAPSLESGEQEDNLSFDEIEAFQYDYQLLVQLGRFTSARIRSASPPDDLQIADVQKWLANVLKLDVRAIRISDSQHRLPYFFAGQIAVQAGDSAKALDYWRLGLKETVKDDLLLYEQIVNLVTYGDGVGKDEAESTLNEFDEAIESNHRRVLALTTNRVSPEQRQRQLDDVDSARGVSRVARAKLLAENSPTVAHQQRIIELLGPLQTDDVELPEKTRKVGFLLLASAYRAIGEMDQVASVMNFALKFFPADEGFIAESGEAWSRAGNLFRANQQWNRAKFSEQFDLRLRALQANIQYQRRIEPEARELGSVRGTLRELEAEIKADPKRLGSFELRLKMIAALLPSEGNAIEEHLVSDFMVENLVKLAEENGDNAMVQAFAAQRFAEAQKTELAQQALKQYASLENVSNLDKEYLKAQLKLASGASKEATMLLTKFAEDHPEESSQALLLAAEVAKQTDDRELAYETLEKIPGEMRSPALVYQAYQLALANDDQQAADAKLAELHRLESHTDAKPGVYSLYIETRDLINELISREGEVVRSDPKLLRARQNVDKLLNLRPYWGNVIALKGWIAYARPRYTEAIELLQRGIAAGDVQFRTRMLLLRALVITRQGAKAEAELKKLSFITGIDLDPYDDISIKVAFQEGRFDDALEMAEGLLKETPNDVTAYLVFANALTFQWKQLASAQRDAGDQSNQEQLDALLPKIRSVLGDALKVASSDEQRAAIADAELRLAIETGDIELVEEISDRIEAGQLDEVDKMLLKGKALLARGETEEAIETFLSANKSRPSPALAIRLASLLRQREDAEQRVAILKAAVDRNPENNQLRNLLARELINSSGTQIDWEQVADLLVEGDAPSLESQFSYAVMLAAKGSSLQRRQAVGILRDIGNGDVSFSLLAKRTQAALMAELSLRDESLDDASRKAYQDEAQKLFIELCGIPNPNKADFVKFSMFLIALKDEQALAQVERLLVRLEKMPKSAIDVYRIQLALASASGNDGRLGDITEDWAKSSSTNQQIKDPSAIAVIAGAALLEKGEIDEALRYYKKAYDQAPERLVDYVVALSRDNRYEETAELCLQHYQEHGDVVSATLLAEALLALDAEYVKREHSEVLSKAVKEYPDNVVLLEAIGTLSMQRNEHQQAIGIYQQVVELEPRRVRALNNLAIALAETPGRERDGLQYVDQAIKLVGSNPELLDTRGTVLLRAKDYDLAIQAFSQAMELSKDPRFKFHKIQAFVGKGDHTAAAQLWKSLDRENLNPRGLTANERESLEELAKRYDGSTTRQQ